jgi:hypothetical protein
MSRFQIIILLFVSFLFSVRLFAQTCPEPIIPCGSFNGNTLVNCGNSLTFEAPINNNNCIEAGINANFGCTAETPQNQTWVVITVTNANGQNLGFEFTNSTNQNTNASIWGPIGSSYTNACDHVGSLPTACDFDAGNPNLVIQNAQTGSIYIMMISNDSNNPTNITIGQPTGGGTVNYCRYTPDPNPCTKPTARVVENKVTREGYYTQIEFQFTGNPPFYYSFSGGAHEYSTQYNWATHYISSDFEYSLAHVRNQCGYGTVPTTKNYVKVLSKATLLRSCYQFDGNTIDSVSANHLKNYGATFSTNRLNQTDKAIYFDGINDYLVSNGRDLPSEEYTLSAWVLPSQVQSGSVQKVLSIGTGIEEQFIGIINTPQSNNQPGWFVGGYLEFGFPFAATAPATLNQWVHVTAVKTIDSLKIYLNGVQIQNARIHANSYPRYGNNPMCRIGSSIRNDQFFNGKIDNLKIFSGALNDQNIWSLYESSSCDFRLCNQRPTAFFSTTEHIKPLKKITSLDLKLNNSNFYVVSNSGEMPRVVNQFHPYYGYNVYSDSSAVKTFKLAYFSGACGSGKMQNEASVTFAPIIEACFEFNNNVQNGVSDYSGPNYIPFTTDRHNNPQSALLFSGLNPLHLHNNFTKGVNNKNFSISAWIAPSPDITNSPESIVSQGSYGTDNSLILVHNSSGQTFLRFQAKTNNNFLEAPISITANQWVHVGVTYINGNVFLYLNGSKIKNGKITNNDDFSDRTTIGGRTSGNYKVFKGKIDDVKIFNGYLTDTQMFEVYQSNDCIYRPCQNTRTPLTASITEVYNPSYGEIGNFKIKSLVAPPYTIEYKLNNETKLFTSSDSIGSINFINQFNQHGFIKLSAVQNPCGFSPADNEVVFNVVPKMLNCYQLNNDGINTLGSNLATLYSTSSSNNRNAQANSALAFNGSNSYVDVPINGIINPEYSISFWVQPQTQLQPNANIISLGTSVKSQKLKFVFDNALNSMAWVFDAPSYSSNLNRVIKSTKGISLNQWHHVAIVRGKSLQQLYIDGVLNSENTFVADGGAGYPYPSCIFVGTGHEANSNFTGNIDDLQFFHGVLNASEIRNIFRASANTCSFTPCLNYQLKRDNLGGTSSIESGKTINSTSTILSNSNIVFDSGSEILLQPGFKTQSGTVFKAVIDGCN